MASKTEQCDRVGLKCVVTILCTIFRSSQQQTTPSKIVVPPKTWFNEKQKKPLEVGTKERNEEIAPQIRPTYKPPVVHHPPPVFRGKKITLNK